MNEDIDYEAMAEATRLAGYGELLGKMCDDRPLALTSCDCGMLTPTPPYNRGAKVDCASCDNARENPDLTQQTYGERPRPTSPRLTIAVSLLVLVAMTWMSCRIQEAPPRPTPQAIGGA